MKNVLMKTIRQLLGTGVNTFTPTNNTGECLKPLKEHGQMDILIKHLEAGKSITALEAIHLCRTSNPTALLTYTRKRLRQEGKGLVSKWETKGGKRWLRYSLGE